VPRELDERVGVAPIPRSIVVASSSARERIERGAQGRPTHRVEERLDEDRAPFAAAHFQRPVLDVLQLLGQERLSVVGVARVSAVSPETAEGVAHGLIKERAFLEWGSGRGRLKRSRSSGHQREMSETEPSLLDGRDALGKSSPLRSNRDRVGRRGRCHPALQTHPLGRAQASLPLLFLSGGERSRDHGELEFDPIDDPAEAGQVVA
jgi:hypothetical protein